MISYIKNLLLKFLGKTPVKGVEELTKKEKGRRKDNKDDDTPEGMYPLW